MSLPFLWQVQGMSPVQILDNFRHPGPFPHVFKVDPWNHVPGPNVIHFRSLGGAKCWRKSYIQILLYTIVFQTSTSKIHISWGKGHNLVKEGQIFPFVGVWRFGQNEHQILSDIASVGKLEKKDFPEQYVSWQKTRDGTVTYVGWNYPYSGYVHSCPHKHQQVLESSWHLLPF